MSEVTFLSGERTLTARISGEIDHHAAKDLREKIDERMMSERPTRLVLDFSGVGFMDSSGIGLVLGRAQRAEEQRATVRLIGLSDPIMRVVRLCGLERIKNLSVEYSRI